jgi:hypothetical protein
MKRVSRASTAGARYLDIQREARRTGRPTDEVIQLYALECFLDRLSRSEFAKNLILKGPVLLAALNARRPTRDIDLAAQALRNSETEILGLVQKIAQVSLDGGLEFDADQATAEIIRDEDEFDGEAFAGVCRTGRCRFVSGSSCFRCSTMRVVARIRRMRF